MATPKSRGTIASLDVSTLGNVIVSATWKATARAAPLAPDNKHAASCHDPEGRSAGGT